MEESGNTQAFCNQSLKIWVSFMPQNIPSLPPVIAPPTVQIVQAPPPPLNTHQVASGVARWAISKGLVEGLHSSTESFYLADVERMSLSVEAETVLRAKGVNSISFSETGRTIFIYTKKKVTNKDLQSLPSNFFGVGIAYPQGAVDPIGKDICSPQGAVFAIHNSATGTHYACGSSISPGNDRSAGTLGALARDSHGALLGLTNNHVTALCSHTLIDTPILAPGVLDVSPFTMPPMTIGFHAKALEMKIGSVDNSDIQTNLDAAVFRIPNELNVTSMQGDSFDTPAVTGPIVEGMRVAKVGRTTGHTQGRIVSRELRPISVKYSVAGYGFSAHILFGNVYSVHGIGGIFSASGDSGSLIVEIDDTGTPMRSVGLLFADGHDSTAPGEMRTFILPLEPILAVLEITLVGGHNV